MPAISSSPPFFVFPSESGRPTIRVPRALASVEHEGTMWLLRSYNGLLFFKREADTQGEALFVLTKTLVDPTPDAAIELWKECFLSDEWARFGVRDWEGGWDGEFRDKVQHDMCFLLAKTKRGQPSGVRISTDLSFDGALQGTDGPENLGVDEHVATFLSVIDTNFKSIHNLKGNDCRKVLLDLSFEELTNKFSTHRAQNSVIKWYGSDDEMSFSDDEDVKGWFENSPAFLLDLIRVFPAKTNLSLNSTEDEFKNILRCACHVHSLAKETGVNYRFSVSCKTPFLTPGTPQLRIPTRRWPDCEVAIPDSFNELCNTISDYFEPTGYKFEADHESSFGSFVPLEVGFDLTAPSPQEKGEAEAQLRQWLDGKVEAEQIEKLLSPSA